jgi:hypothetical protein
VIEALEQGLEGPYEDALGADINLSYQDRMVRAAFPGSPAHKEIQATADRATALLTRTRRLMNRLARVESVAYSALFVVALLVLIWTLPDRPDRVCQHQTPAAELTAKPATVAPNQAPPGKTPIAVERPR